MIQSVIQYVPQDSTTKPEINLTPITKLNAFPVWVDANCVLIGMKIVHVVLDIIMTLQTVLLDTFMPTRMIMLHALKIVQSHQILYQKLDGMEAS